MCWRGEEVNYEVLTAYCEIFSGVSFGAPWSTFTRSKRVSRCISARLLKEGVSSAEAYETIAPWGRGRKLCTWLRLSVHPYFSSLPLYHFCHIKLVRKFETSLISGKGVTKSKRDIQACSDQFIIRRQTSVSSILRDVAHCCSFLISLASLFRVQLRLLSELCKRAKLPLFRETCLCSLWRWCVASSSWQSCMSIILHCLSSRTADPSE